MNHQRCLALYLEAQGVKHNVKSLSLRLTHILFSDICPVLPYLSFASCFSVIWGRRSDLLIGLTDTILTLTVMLKMNTFPFRDGSSTLQVIWKVQARCIVGSQIIPVCFFMLTGWPHNSSSLRMGILHGFEVFPVFQGHLSQIGFPWAYFSLSFRLIAEEAHGCVTSSFSWLCKFRSIVPITFLKKKKLF